MNRKTILLVSVAAIIIYMQTPGASSHERLVLSEKMDPAATELISGYKNWTRVNPVPAIFYSRLAVACFIPSAADRKLEEENPHRDKFITVYVNDPGRRPLMEQKESRYPRGSIIVKEKLTTKESQSPELLTVMVKREPGFNPKNGDWEYMVFDGPGEKLFARGKLDKCQACHATYDYQDYVSRNYLPRELWDKLK